MGIGTLAEVRSKLAERFNQRQKDAELNALRSLCLVGPRLLTIDRLTEMLIAKDKFLSLWQDDPFEILGIDFTYHFRVGKELPVLLSSILYHNGLEPETFKIINAVKERAIGHMRFEEAKGLYEGTLHIGKLPYMVIEPEQIYRGLRIKPNGEIYIDVSFKFPKGRYVD